MMHEPEKMAFIVEMHHSSSGKSICEIDLVHRELPYVDRSRLHVAVAEAMSDNGVVADEQSDRQAFVDAYINLLRWFGELRVTAEEMKDEYLKTGKYEDWWMQYREAR